MQAQASYPILTAAIELLTDWWKRHERRSRHELANLCDSDVARIAKDIGVSTGELRALDQRADLPLALPRMMAALQLDPASVARTEPDVYRDLQRVCALCGAKKRCALDLADGDAAIYFEGYCPNAHTLRDLC